MKGEHKDLKDALQNWTNQQLQPPPVVPHHIYQPRPSERVVDGDIIRTPVDRVAARVVAKAPWWAHPPDQKPMKEHIDPITSDVLSQGSEVTGPLPGRKKQKDIDTELVSLSANRFAKNVENTEALVKRANDATDAIEYICTHFKKEWLDFDDFITNALTKSRATKVAFEIENRQLLASLRDVREFFLDDKHAVEVAKLKEFVELCERLQKLKASGFLDVVADTILKLS